MHALLLSLVLAGAAAGAAPPPWEGAPFAAEPSALAAAAAALEPPKDSAVDVLLEEWRISLDEQGRATEEYRLVAVPRTADGARGWGTTERAFSPWYQERAEVRARVVSPEGVATWLDPTTLTEGPLGGEDPDVYSDRRIVRGPLPRVVPRAVVEEWSRRVDREPFFAAGQTLRLYQWRPQPVRWLRVRVDAPAALPLRHESVGLPAPSERTEAGRRIVEWEVANLPAAKRLDSYAPPEAVEFRRIGVSTGPSWRAVAAGYAAIAERQLEGADLAATAREIIGSSDGPEAATQRILTWLSGKARYTSLALGEAAIVPARPAQVLERGYGDCKDLSLLVVGLLRAAGHPASLALVRTRSDEVRPGLPGLGEFDHAIVKVGGRRPFFVDPTQPHVFAGELPSWLQGRLALEVSDRASALERIPEAPPSRVLKVRRVELPESGSASISEHTELWGTAAADSRDPRAWDREAWTKVARARLAATEGAEVTFEVKPAATRAAPVVLEMRASASGYGQTADDEAVAYVPPGMVFRELGPWFPAEDDDDERRSWKPDPRELPLLLDDPFVAELRYDVVPPPGFAPGALPPPAVERLAPGAVLESRWAADAAGVVTVTYRLAVEPRRLAPAAADALRAEVERRVRADDPKVTFARTAVTLANAGKHREAIAELRRLIALHPGEARHRNHLAVALLDLGLVAAARRTAREAVALEPGLEWSHRVLAYTLAHDLVGRELAEGCDLAGAIAAQRQARELSPASTGTRSRLARLLEQGARGERYGAGARLEEAAAERRHVREVLKDASHDLELATLLLHLGRLDEAAEVARGAPEGDERTTLLAAVAAVKGGLAGLRREAGALGASQQAVQAAVVLLMNTRQYATLAAIMQGTPGDGAATFAELLGRARPLGALRLDPADPAGLPVLLFQTLFGPDPGAVGDLVAKACREEPDDLEELRTLSRGIVAGMTGQLGKQGISLSSALDLGAAGLSTKVEGSGPWRVTASVPDEAGKVRAAFVAYAVKEDGRVRLAVTEAASPAEPGFMLGAAAFSLAREGRFEDARALLEWLRGRATGEGPSRACLATLVPAAGKASPDELLAGAACVAAFSPRPPRGTVDALDRARLAASGEARRLLTRHLGYASLAATAWERALAAADELERGGAQDAERAWFMRVTALSRGGKAPAARALLDARLRDHPGELRTISLLAAVAEQEGRLEEAARLRARVAAGEAPSADDLNRAAWLGLFVPAAAGDAPARIDRALGSPGGRTPGKLHTKAAVLAARGEVREALGVLHEAVAMTERPDTPANALVLGKIAEAVGLEDEAAAAYRRAVEDPDRSAMGVAALASRWQAELTRRAAAPRRR